jgi:hypothetical protein
MTLNINSHLRNYIQHGSSKYGSKDQTLFKLMKKIDIIGKNSKRIEYFWFTCLNYSFFCRIRVVQ